ncbi:MAG TPA: hypothetical protein VNL15_03915 [Dehalococcoidia bacterium]|nr:hypothetical protein [Dehalococcoidia bacterium]
MLRKVVYILALSALAFFVTVITSSAHTIPNYAKIDCPHGYVYAGVEMNPASGSHPMPTGPVIPIPPICTPTNWLTDPATIDFDGSTARFFGSDHRHMIALHAGEAAPAPPWDFDVSVGVVSGPFGANEATEFGSVPHTPHKDNFMAVVGTHKGTNGVAIIGGSIGLHERQINRQQPLRWIRAFPEGEPMHGAAPAAWLFGFLDPDNPPFIAFGLVMLDMPSGVQIEVTDQSGNVLGALDSSQMQALGPAQFMQNLGLQINPQAAQIIMAGDARLRVRDGQMIIAQSPILTDIVRIMGDDDCNGSVTTADSIKKQLYVAALPYEQNEPCPDIGSTFASLWGDVDCNNSVDLFDALKVQLWIVGQLVEQTEPCPDIGEAVSGSA